ncbi:MAG: SDR family NAD(P)-dependent oxidoreductase [Hyphomicrobiales bacterium]|jgi:L-rhamnose 1-dehydrogenase
MLLDGKRAVITGGSRGIGRGTAEAFAAHGADVVIGYYAGSDCSHDADAASASVEAVKRYGRKAIAVEGDIGNAQTAKDLIEAACDTLGGVDILVSNAGVCPFHGFLDMPEALLRSVIDTNLTGAYLVTQAAANQMKAQGSGGAIMAISSISALVGGGMQTHYTPTKAGVHSLMQSASIVLGEYGIRCNSIMPGAILTDMNREDLSGTEKRAYFNKRIPLGRLGEPADIGNVAVFLASDLAGYVTGASLLVDGGMFVNLQ